MVLVLVVIKQMPALHDAGRASDADGLNQGKVRAIAICSYTADDHSSGLGDEHAP